MKGKCINWFRFVRYLFEMTGYCTAWCAGLFTLQVYQFILLCDGYNEAWQLGLLFWMRVMDAKIIDYRLCKWQQCARQLKLYSTLLPDALIDSLTLMTVSIDGGVFALLRFRHRSIKLEASVHPSIGVMPLAENNAFYELWLKNISGNWGNRIEPTDHRGQYG